MQVTTFYSYKGGLGRTLLVAWCAKQVASQGQSVVALDLDLEAPGLPFKLGFSSKDDLGPGVVGLLSRFLRGEEPPRSLEDWVRPVPNHRGLWLLPAGPLASTDYWRDLASISWKALFFEAEPQGARFFTWLREGIAREFKPDHLLIDSRTGVTEMGGAALSLLADQILALLGTSPEGVHGTREVLRAVVGAPRAPGRAAPRIGLILARMPAHIAPPALQKTREAIRATICEEAGSLTATVEAEIPLVIRSEPDLQRDEARALKEEDLRVHQDYKDVLAWILGSSVPANPPGVIAHREGSMEELQNSIALQRQLAERDPESYLPDLAESLVNLGAILANQGRADEAQTAIEAAVAIRRRLATMRPADFLPDLAASLGSLGYLLRDLGKHEQGRQALEEAVSIYRSLANSGLDVFFPRLAVSLNNLSNCLGELGERENALLAIEEAVACYRRLVDERPEVFQPALAGSLSNLSNRLGELGRHEPALRAIEEAVAGYRGLAVEHPDALAASLNNLSGRLAELGRHEQALGAIEEAASKYRVLAEKRPEVFRPYLAASLSNLAIRLHELGRKVEAQRAHDEAVAIRPELAKPEV